MLQVDTYIGKHGISLILDGVEPGINDKAQERAIVMHGADYVSRSFIRIMAGWAEVSDVLQFPSKIMKRLSTCFQAVLYLYLLSR